MSSDLDGERFIDLPVPALIRVIPESVVAVAIIGPSGMVDDRIKADPCNRDRLFEGDRYLVTDVSKPIRPEFVFDARLRDEKRLPIAIMEFCQDLVQRTVFLVTSRDLSPARMPPLVMEVVVQSDYIDGVGFDLENSIECLELS